MFPVHLLNICHNVHKQRHDYINIYPVLTKVKLLIFPCAITVSSIHRISVAAKDNKIGTITHLPSLGYKLMNVETVTVTASNYTITILGLSSTPLQLILYYSSILQVIYFDNRRIAHQKRIVKSKTICKPKKINIKGGYWYSEFILNLFHSFYILPLQHTQTPCFAFPNNKRNRVFFKKCVI